MLTFHYSTHFLLLLTIPLLIVATTPNNQQQQQQQQNKPPSKNNKPPSLPSPTTILFIDGLNNKYSCSFTEMKGDIINKCPDGISTPENSLVSVKLTQWAQTCSGACIRHTLDKTHEPKQCVGITLVNKQLCAMALCNRTTTTTTNTGQVAQTGPASHSSGKAKGKKKFKSITAVFPSSCFVKLPKPSQAPIAVCTDPRMTVYNSKELDMSLFDEVLPNKYLCELVEIKGPGGLALFTTLTSFKCEYQSCLRYCQYDSGCKYAFFSDVTKTCVKSNKLQLTDDPTRFQQYFDEKWRAFRRIDGDGKIPYYSGACNQNPADKCNKQVECRWDKGKEGYNDEDFGGAAGGYCGRIKCSAAPKPPTTKKHHHSG
jgi:hypothetical protein